MEDKPLAVFHRLARYPDVDEKDLNTGSDGKELVSAVESPTQGSCCEDGLNDGNELPSVTNSPFVRRMRSWECFGTTGSCDSLDSTASPCRLFNTSSCEVAELSML